MYGTVQDHFWVCLKRKLQKPSQQAATSWPDFYFHNPLRASISCSYPLSHDHQISFHPFLPALQDNFWKSVFSSSQNRYNYSKCFKVITLHLTIFILHFHSVSWEHWPGNMSAHNSVGKKEKHANEMEHSFSRHHVRLDEMDSRPVTVFRNHRCGYFRLGRKKCSFISRWKILRYIEVRNYSIYCTQSNYY